MIERLNPKVKSAIGFILLLCVPLMVLAALQIGKEDPKDAEIPTEEDEVVAEYLPPVVENEIVEEITVATEQDKEEAQRVAAEFLAAFHSIDPEKPHAYFEESQKYMTEEMKNQYQGIPKRGSLAAQAVEIVAMETAPTELQSDLQIWTIELYNKLTAGDGTTSMATDQYSVMLVKNGDNWLVDGVRVNEQQ